MSDYFAGSGWSRKYGQKALPVLVNLAKSRRPTTYNLFPQFNGHLAAA